MNSKTLVGLLVIGTVLISGCIQPSDIEYCEQDRDCTIAIRTDICCPCPFVTTKKRVDSDSNLVMYELGKDYSSLFSLVCREVECATKPCGGALGAVCSNNSCQEPRTWEDILRVCPDCYTPAATAAYREGDFEKAIKTCNNDTSKDFFGIENKENCILSLARITLNENETIEICSNYLEKLQGVCLREVAQEIAKKDIERALKICENITDVSSIGYSPKNNCFHNIAVTARKTNERRALEICEMMSERVEECKDLIKNYCTKYPC